MRALKQLRREETNLQDKELSRLIDCVKHEVQRKYHDELRTLCLCVKDLKQRLTDELLTKQKELKQLHLQH